MKPGAQIRFTLAELEALGEACGFRLSGELEDDDSGAEEGRSREALERAHEKVSRLRERAALRARKAAR
jgi:hypothetical protein